MPPELLSRLKAPREHGAFLAHPPLDEVGSLLAANRARLAQPVTILGHPLSALRRTAHAETLAAAHRYLADAHEPVPHWTADTWLVAGHQPEFFHPGVWVKNFVLHSLARRHGAVPLNLVVDDDTAKATHFLVPAGHHRAKVRFDCWQSEVPFEERHVLDEAMFASFPERIRPYREHWPFRPWLDEVWAEVRKHADTPLLGERIVRTRRSLERSIGLVPLEVPLSAVCRTETFAWFGCAVLAELPRFHEAYNGAIDGYRERHDLRSKNHPAPDLGRQGSRWEAPFWAWRVGGQRRHRLFVEFDGSGATLWAGGEALARLDGDARTWPKTWFSLESQGIKIRTRALTTTLYSRLFLADVFLHGIGGGKYDEVTDTLINSFFGLEPPQYMVVTATLHLPLPRHPHAAEELANLHRRERDLWYNPQRHLAADASPLLAERRVAVAASQATHVDRVDRFHRLQRINEQLRPLVDGELVAARSRIERLQMEADDDRIAAGRDYPFPLYPEVTLRDFFETIGTRRSETVSSTGR
jgi:hypothetical protein